MRQILTIVFFLTVTALYLACTGNPNVGNSRNLTATKDIFPVPIDSGILYFPAAKFVSDSTNRLDSFTNTWYSKMLFGLHEPILFDVQDSADVFRFTWLRTFHKPIAIRLTKTKGDAILTLKIADGASGYNAGKLLTDTSFYISDSEWGKFTIKISDIHFWEMQSVKNDNGKDGSEWILEGKSEGKYHFVSRWTPGGTRYKEFKDCCDYLIQLANLNLNDRERY
ncbi:MAG: hypothetical protein PHD73_12675 [Sediminibacterium sp.]|nr:hypothetical protein [Sediminibacterium sp.]